MNRRVIGIDRHTILYGVLLPTLYLTIGNSDAVGGDHVTNTATL